MKLENNKNCQKLQPRKRPKQFEQRASSAQCPQRAEETEQQASQQHQVYPPTDVPFSPTTIDILLFILYRQVVGNVTTYPHK